MPAPTIATLMTCFEAFGVAGWPWVSDFFFMFWWLWALGLGETPGRGRNGGKELNVIPGQLIEVIELVEPVELISGDNPR